MDGDSDELRGCEFAVVALERTHGRTDLPSHVGGHGPG